MQRKQRKTRQAVVGLVAVLATALLGGSSRVGAQPVTGQSPTVSAEATQTSEAGQVTVRVTWNGPASGLGFQVAMDTHSVDLDGYDLGKLSVLRADTGAEVRPAAWDAPPGGHHREGRLVFPDRTADGTDVLGPGAKALTLVIRDVAVPERVFRWTW